MGICRANSNGKITPTKKNKVVLEAYVWVDEMILLATLGNSRFDVV